MKTVHSILLTVLALCIAGCWGNSSRPIDPQAFIAPPPPGEALPPPAVQPEMSDPRLEPVPQPPETKKTDPANAISEQVREQIRPPGENPSATLPANAPPATSRSSGGYFTLGGVVCDVNGAPIFSNKIVDLLEKSLSVKARELDEEQFKLFAGPLIEKTANELVRDELQSAAAERELGPDDKKHVDFLTVQWKQKRITESGGSLEIARRNALADGNDFEELVERQHRLIMRQLYFQKKLFPRIQISADDRRQYYNRNVAKLFTEQAAARFRLIKISGAATGTKEAANAKIEGLRKQIVGGEKDFSAVAASINDDPRLKKQGGDVGWIQRGAYKEEKVENAVWQTAVGDITPIVDSGDSWFIAKVEEKKAGRTKAFEEEAVQDAIYKELWQMQVAALQQKVEDIQRRQGQAVISPDPPRYDLAMDLVLQKYPQWKSVSRFVAPLEEGK